MMSVSTNNPTVLTTPQTKSVTMEKRNHDLDCSTEPSLLMYAMLKLVRFDQLVVLVLEKVLQTSNFPQRVRKSQNSYKT